ncbi:MAG: AraC family transcriptional regulator [Oceanospirillaceae bacterium]|nr:AraC family transcriptional regulator [Oceanospirillaceae bacterium]
MTPIRFDFDQELVAVCAQTVARAIANGGIGSHRLRPPVTKASNAYFKFRKIGDLSFAEYGYGSTVRVRESLPAGYVHLRIVLDGQCQWSAFGKKNTLDAGASVVSPFHTDVQVTYSADCRVLIVEIPESFMLETAREFGYIISSDRLAFLDDSFVFPDVGPMRNLISDLSGQDRSALSDDRVVFYYSRLLGHEILRSYGKDLCKSSAVPMSYHPYIEQIRDHVLENVAQNLSINELAKLCRISLKSLYNLFERELGMTPSSYIRRLKLERVYSELRSDLNTRNVTEIALKYGFSNLSRFSVYYREHIGELPSDTLRRFSH